MSDRLADADMIDGCDYLGKNIAPDMKLNNAIKYNNFFAHPGFDNFQGQLVFPTLDGLDSAKNLTQIHTRVGTFL